VMHIYAESLSQAHNSLEQTQTHLEDMSQLQDTTARKLEASEEQLCEAGKKRKLMELEHQETIEQLKASHRTDLDAAQEAANSQLLRAAEQHATELAMEQQRAAGLVADLEHEGMKRRKIERQKAQLQVVGNNALGVGAEGVDAALSELKAMQQQLDEAHAEINTLRANGGDTAATAATTATNRTSASSSEEPTAATAAVDALSSSSSSTGSLRAPVTRSRRGRAAGGGGGGGGMNPTNPNPTTAPAATASTSANGGGGGATDPTTLTASLGYSGYLEQAEYAEKRIELLTREKRELLSKSLEEIKEKNEVSQKLLLIEKENTSLKAELRKLVLDKERSERKLIKQLESATSAQTNKENVVN